MAILKCKMCGGTLDYDQQQNLAVCPYCGNKSTVFDQDRKLFEQFQNQFAALLNQNPKATPEEGFWVDASREELVREDGAVMEITYLAKRKADLCTMYVARRNLIGNRAIELDPEDLDVLPEIFVSLMQYTKGVDRDKILAQWGGKAVNVASHILRVLETPSDSFLVW